MAAFHSPRAVLMTDPRLRLHRFWAELRRRRVPRAAALYGVAGWAVIEVATATFPYLGIPDWAVTLVIALVALGFPLALVVAWMFDITPEGLRSAEAVEAAPPNSATGRRGSRLTAGLAMVAVLVVAIFGGTRVWGGGGAPAASADVVAVFPFAIRGGPDLAYLGEGMVNLLSTKLDGAGELRSVDPRAVLSRLSGSGGETDPDAAAESARRLGAGRLVLGDVVEGGDRLRVNATLYELGSGRARRVVDGTAEGAASDLFGLVDEVAAQLLAEAVGGTSRVRRIAAVTTPSLPAFKAYVAGDVAFREGRYADAIAALEEAVAEDSLFALAWYRLSLASEYGGRALEAMAAAERAHRNAGRLAERDRRLLEAFMAWRSADSYTAERLYRAHISSYPDDVEAWFELGEVLFHLNPLRGRPFVESEEAFSRVLAYEPGHAGSLIHLIRIAYAHRDLAAMDTLVAALEAEQGDRTVENLALRAFAHGDSAGIARVLDRLGRSSDRDIAFALWVVGAYGGNMDGAEAITDIMVRPHASPAVRTMGHVTRAFLDLGRGQWRNAMAEIDLAAEIDPTQALEFGAWLQLSPFAPTQPEDLLALRERLAAMDSAMLAASSGTLHSVLGAHDGQHPILRDYLLGLTSAALGDVVAADSFAAAVLRHRDDVANPQLVQDYATFIRARTLLQRRRPADAMAELDRLNLAGAYPLFYSPFHNHALERFTIAETLVGLGRREDALGWYANIAGTSTLELALLYPARLRQAEILEALGRTDEAADLYREVVAAWADADPELAHLRDEAERALQRLGSAAVEEG
jgi:tetratricopeptide (TPR) repeat protein/TolB-like protein